MKRVLVAGSLPLVRLLLPERLLTRDDLDPYYAGIAGAIGEHL